MFSFNEHGQRWNEFQFTTAKTERNLKPTDDRKQCRRDSKIIYYQYPYNFLVDRIIIWRITQGHQTASFGKYLFGGG